MKISEKKQAEEQDREQQTKEYAEIFKEFEREHRFGEILTDVIIEHIKSKPLSYCDNHCVRIFQDAANRTANKGEPLPKKVKESGIV